MPSPFQPSSSRITAPALDKPFTKPAKGGSFKPQDEPKFAHKPTRPGGDSPSVKDWIDAWDKRTQEREESKREGDVVAEEKRLGLESLKSIRTGKPGGQMDELKAGLNEGLSRVGQVVAGASSLLGIKGAETRRRMYKERAETYKKYRNRDRKGGGLSGGDIASAAISEAPGFINPFTKAKWVAKVGNSAFHAIRGYSKDKSKRDGAAAVASHLIGEKAEDVVTRGKGLIGNTVGNSIENLLQQ